VLWRQRLGWIDARARPLYVAYLWVLMRNPPREVERSPMHRGSHAGVWPAGWRQKPIGDCSAWRSAVICHRAPVPELDDRARRRRGISQFFLVQWVAPFLSEFPEFVSTFSWARRVTRAHGAHEHRVQQYQSVDDSRRDDSVVYGFSHLHHHGVWADFPLDIAQRNELALTLLQTMLECCCSQTWNSIGWTRRLFVLWPCSSRCPSCASRSWSRTRVAVVLVIGFVVKGQPLRRRVLLANHPAKTKGRDHITWTGRSCATGNGEVIEARK